jgi:hypothetical protein
MLFAVIREAVYRRISRWDVGGYMDVRNAPEWPRSLVFGVVVALATLSSVRVISAAETRKTFEDRFAEQDIRDAAQDIDRMHRILGAELRRLVGQAGGSESDDVPPYLHESSGKRMDLGDVRIPLSTRYVERERRQMVAAIALAKAESAEKCGDTSLDAKQFLDAAFRAKVLAALKCHQRQLDRLQSGTHKLNQDYEGTLLELKLPSFTQESMLAEAHASTLRQDAELASGYADSRRGWQADVDFLTYLDGHAAHARYVNNKLLFDDPAEAIAMQELLNRIKAVNP